MDRIGRYKIVRELGRGAMGVVYHAIDPNIGRPVAIKTIQLGERRTAEEQERLRERLFREARSAGMLSHPGIVTIYDVDQENDLAYIAMEFVDGTTLDQWLSEQQVVPPERLFSILAQTANALDYAHQKGIVHRDIKPANIMLAADGSAKITDFGIAKITASAQFTQTGSIVGTPHYMSPEQVQGVAVDGRSDQFSLGVIAYEMLTGEKPYTGENLSTVVYKIVAEDPIAPHRLNPSLEGPIDAAIRKALSKKPENRYRTCREFAEALEKACEATTGWKALPRGGGLNAPTQVDSAVKPVPELPPARRPVRADSESGERPRRRRSGFLSFLLAILVAAGLLALIGWQYSAWTGPHGSRNSLDEAALGDLTRKTAPLDDTKPSPMSPAVPETSKPLDTAANETKPPRDETTAKPEPAKPEPPKPEPVKPAPAPAEKKLPPAPAVVLQPVQVISSPGGATAMLDGQKSSSCTTPCSLMAAPGRHSVSLSLPGYQIDRRDVDVGSAPVDLPPVILRAPYGTLMLSSVPEGAAVTVNGKRIPQTTNTQIQLVPGSYRITVDKDGRQGSATVEIRNDEIRTLRLILGQ